jgi:hypothetical protein
MVTRTGDGIPGDALNVGLVGNQEDITRASMRPKFPADPITLRTSIEIIGSVMLDQPTTTRRSVRSITREKGAACL